MISLGPRRVMAWLPTVVPAGILLVSLLAVCGSLIDPSVARAGLRERFTTPSAEQREYERALRGSFDTSSRNVCRARGVKPKYDSVRYPTLASGFELGVLDWARRNGFEHAGAMNGAVVLDVSNWYFLTVRAQPGEKGAHFVARCRQVSDSMATVFARVRGVRDTLAITGIHLPIPKSVTGGQATFAGLFEVGGSFCSEGKHEPVPDDRCGLLFEFGARVDGAGVSESYEGVACCHPEQLDQWLTAARSAEEVALQHTNTPLEPWPGLQATYVFSLRFAYGDAHPSTARALRDFELAVQKAGQDPGQGLVVPDILVSVELKSIRVYLGSELLGVMTAPPIATRGAAH